jgi:Uma2 family endonuclease
MKMAETMTADKIKNPVEELARLGVITVERRFSIEEFRQVAARYPDLLMEREKNGKLVVMSPVKAGSGQRENELSFHLTLWNRQNNLGKVFNASTGIELPDGAIKSPDVAWVSVERLNMLPPGSLENDFLQAVPDFIAEIRSKTDRLARLKRKMADTWMRNGVRLGWLIDPFEERVYLYRQGRPDSEIVSGFDNRRLGGEDVLPGFELPLEEFKIVSG